MAEILAFPNRGHRSILNKRQLANHLGRSTRWVELMTRDRGLPAEWDVFGRERRYDVGAVESWLREFMA